MRSSSGYASNLGSTKPSYSCGRGRGLDFVASRLKNAAAHDWRRIEKSWLDMDAAGLEADSAPVAAGQKGSSPDKAPNLAAEQGRAESATTLAPKVEQPAPRKPRQAWSGKYADLTPPKKGGA
jgi:hypothetical protein